MSELSEEEITYKNFQSKPRTASPAPSVEDPANAVRFLDNPSKAQGCVNNRNMGICNFYVI